MTYTVSSGTLNPTQLNSTICQYYVPLRLQYRVQFELAGSAKNFYTSQSLGGP